MSSPYSSLLPYPVLGHLPIFPSTFRLLPYALQPYALVYQDTVITAPLTNLALTLSCTHLTSLLFSDFRLTPVSPLYFYSLQQLKALPCPPTLFLALVLPSVEVNPFPFLLIHTGTTLYTTSNYLVSCRC